MSKISTARNLIFGGIASLAIVACSDPQAANQTQAPEPPKVSVAHVVHERITEWDEFTGRLQAPQTVNLMPRVSGYVNEVHFTEGALVDKGGLLIQIDPLPFMAEVDRLKADLKSAKSAYSLASKDYDRAEKLSSQRAISAELLDSRSAHKEQTSATVDSVQAALRRAELELSYTRITAPISGRVSYAQVTAGNYVNAGQSQLTSLVSSEKMYAYFDVDEQSYLKYARLSTEGKRANTRDVSANPVYMALASDSDFGHVGHVDFVDNRMNAQTGTIRLRASFPNDDSSLMPGFFARIKLVGSDTYEGVLIDEKAIGTDLNNKFVLVVDDNNTVEYRAITLGEKLHGLRIVQDGLEADERIVVNGLQRVRPKMQITPELVKMVDSEQLFSLRSAQNLLHQTSNTLTAQVTEAATRE